MPFKPKTNSEKIKADERNSWRYTGIQQQRDRARGSSSERGYDSKWVKARKYYLIKHPLCVYCKRAGRVEAATVVDHIIPHKGDMKLFWDSDNWQSLCSECHNSIKRREENRMKRKSE